jgi:hypothetical protein
MYKVQESCEFPVIGTRLREHLLSDKEWRSRNFDFDGDNARGDEAFRKN